MDRKSLMARTEKWQTEFDECLAWARSNGENQISQALQTCKKTLASLANSGEKSAGSFPKDFWFHDSSESNMNKIVDQIISRISDLKLPHASSSKRKEVNVARRRS